MPLRHNTMSPAKKTRPIKGSKANWLEAISSELEKAERLYVLGIGNRRKGDDAAGSLCVRLLRKEMARKKRRADRLPADSGRPLRTLRKGVAREVRVLDAGEAPENATGLIRELRPTHVLIVDAAVGGHQPGTIFVIEKEKIRQEDISTHRLPLAHLVRYLEESIGCRVILVGIEPQEVAWGKPVSATVRAAVSHLAAGLAHIWTAPRP
jgi:hydrogenase 3 maturation protease